MRKVILAALAGAGMAASLAVAGPAAADPTDVYPAALNGSGSDTTEIVMRELDLQIDALGSWDVGGPTPYDTNGGAAGCSFGTRILGSGAGRTALANSVTLGDGCWQYARSSSRSVSQNPGTVAGTYTASGSAVLLAPIALAEDGLTYVFRQGSSTPRDLTIGQLRAIYNCTFTGVVDGRSLSSPSIPNQPLLPTDASGSRADWLALMQQPTNGEVASDGPQTPPVPTLPACIQDGPGDSGPVGAGGSEFAEHNGNVLANGRQIILHSIAQYIAQGRSATGDTRGFAQLGYVNGNVPLTQLNATSGGDLLPGTASGSAFADGAYFRTVYNVVPRDRADDADIIAVFGERAGGTDPNGSDVPIANSGSGICDLDATILDNGFLPVC